jgi:hypothetical protein
VTSSSNGYLALVVDRDLRVRSYGPYPNEAAAQDLATTIGFSDPDVVAARVTPLAGPDVCGFGLNALTRAAPHAMLAHLTAQQPDPGTAAVVLLTDIRHDQILTVGPFPNQDAALTWLASNEHPGDLQPQVIALLAGPLPHPDHATRPHVVLILDATAAPACYGPWPDALHATAWVHQHVNPHPASRVVLLEVAPPFDLAGAAPPHTPPSAGPGRLIVRLWDDADTNAAVGLFADQADAKAWLDSQSPYLDTNLATMTVIDPGRYA